jgi:N-acetylmuramoyl-L-alanine amidase
MRRRLSIIRVLSVMLAAVGTLGAVNVARAQAGKAQTPEAGSHAAWDVVKYEGRDYLSLRNVADFYKLQYTSSGRGVTLQSPGCVIRGDVGSKELIINGVKFIMSSDLVASGDKILLSRLDLTKLVEPVLRPNRIRGAGAIRTVVIDAGHGGYDRGATSIYGDEKNFALDTALRLRELLLRRGLNVQMTRSTDVFIPLEERAAFANRFRDGIFVCIHYNAGSDFGTGIETYTLAPRFVPSTGDDSPTASCMIPCAGNVEDPENMALATATHAALLSRLPMVDRGIKRARFCVLRLTTIPAVLIEGGFVSNPQEASRIATPAYRQAEAEAISLAISNYMTATNVGGSRPPILAGTSGEHPSLSITPGGLQMQGGIPAIGASVPIDPMASRVNNLQEGPTVVVPRSN